MAEGVHDAYVAATMLRWVDDEPQPGIIDVEFVDGFDAVHTFSDEKWVYWLYDDTWVDRNTQFPVVAAQPCRARAVDDQTWEITFAPGSMDEVAARYRYIMRRGQVFRDLLLTEPLTAL